MEEEGTHQLARVERSPVVIPGAQGSRMRNHKLNKMRESKTELPRRRSKASKSALKTEPLFT
jgi:hypothetical protein